ncbi:MAG: hypothetical protein IT160_07105 [Bryobacterales bacterium]|nr:hypothetical protein [Bryobacterales bacterium]
MFRTLGEVSPQPQYYDEPGIATFDKVLAAGTEYGDLAQNFDKDADFYWTALSGTQTGAYQVQFILPDGRNLSTSMINNANVIGTGQFPVPIWPTVLVPAGSKIGLRLKDTSGAQNTVQICFVGMRRYRSGR